MSNAAVAITIGLSIAICGIVILAVVTDAKNQIIDAIESLKEK